MLPSLQTSSQQKRTNKSDKMLLSWPDETLKFMLEFTRPAKQCQEWERICIIGCACKGRQKIAHESFAPTTFNLEDFRSYNRLVDPKRQSCCAQLYRLKDFFSTGGRAHGSMSTKCRTFTQGTLSGTNKIPLSMLPQYGTVLSHASLQPGHFIQF